MRGVAGFDGETEGAGHRDRIGRFSDGGIEQHGVVTQFHGLRRMRRCAETRIDHQRDIGQAFAQ